MTLVDTSVVVAAFASWHAQHAKADSMMDGKTLLVAHCAVETYSVLTRLPPPHRVAPHLVRDFLAARFPNPYVGLEGNQFAALIPWLVELGISGGAAYEALVAAAALAAGDILISCDVRAAQTYERIGVEFRLLN